MKSFKTITIVTLMAAVFFLTGQPSMAQAEKMSVMLYSSMKDKQLSELKANFKQKYPDIQMDYYSASTGKVMTKLTAEERAGNISCDIVWVGDPTNYFSLKENNLLLPYVSPEAKTIPSSFKDPDNMYCAARIITLGMVYNVNTVKGADIPTDWNDMLKPRFGKSVTVMTDPTFSGTSLYAVAALSENPKFGWAFFEKAKSNGMRVEKGSSAVVNKTGAGEYDICIGVDYIARSKQIKGMPIKFVYPESGMVTVPSPIAIFKNTKNINAAKLLYDYILSLEGQKVLIKTQVMPVRPELTLAGAITIQEAIDRALPINVDRLKNEKDQILKKFDNILKKK